MQLCLNGGREMLRTTLLEMCIVSLLALPDDRLSQALPTLAALAEPYIDDASKNNEINRCIRQCLRQIQNCTADGQTNRN